MVYRTFYLYKILSISGWDLSRDISVMWHDIGAVWQAQIMHILLACSHPMQVIHTLVSAFNKQYEFLPAKVSDTLKLARLLQAWQRNGSQLLGIHVINISSLRLPDKLPGTSQMQCFPWASLLHGGHSWKWQHPFKDKTHDDDDDDEYKLSGNRTNYNKYSHCVSTDAPSGQTSTSSRSDTFCQRSCRLLTVHISSLSHLTRLSATLRFFSARTFGLVSDSSLLLQRVQQDFWSTTSAASTFDLAVHACQRDPEPTEWEPVLPGTMEQRMCLSLLPVCCPDSWQAKADLWRRTSCSSLSTWQHRAVLLATSSRKLCSRQAMSSYCCCSMLASTASWPPDIHTQYQPCSFTVHCKKYAYIHGYFVASFPYFNGTSSVYVFPTVALWRIARICRATILYLSTDSALVILD